MIYSKGIALLLSVIIISIVLAISMGISNIVSTEISLSNTGRQSQLAFYAADAGVDCAIYWDTVNDGDPGSAFATSSPSQKVIECAGDNSNVGGWSSCGIINPDGSFSPSACSGAGEKKAGRSTLTLNFSNGSCAIVEIVKRQDDPAVPAALVADIHADGFSSACNSTSQRVFQRSLETTIYE